MPFNLTMSELAVVLVLALIFLGPKKLPELASGLGKMIREIKKVTAGVKEDIQLDENVRKPFEELREALTLPAEELKRRDDWKAEWEKRQEEEAAAAAAQASETAAAEPAAGDAPGVEATTGDGEADQDSGKPAQHADSHHAKSDVGAGFEPTAFAGGASTAEADKTIATSSPAPSAISDRAVTTPLGAPSGGFVGGSSDKSASTSAHKTGSSATSADTGPAAPADKAPSAPASSPGLSDKTMVSAAPSGASGERPVLRLPTAPPVGAVAASGRTMIGVLAPRPGLSGSSPTDVPPAASRPAPSPGRATPPPPPPAARLPVPKVAAREIPKPESAANVPSSTSSASSDGPPPKA